MPETFQAYRVEKQDNEVSRSLQTMQLSDLPEGEVLVEVHYSSLNYKDALSATGNPGVTKHYPHTPGIDAAGVVRDSSHPDIRIGDEVIVTSYDLGMNTPGGFGQYIRVPAAWVVPKPAGLSLREAMILGTAGLTAGMCVQALLEQGLQPEQGAVLVSGATGGVGSVAVAILAKLGFQVTASTGKAEAHDWLKALGATEVQDRRSLEETSSRPLLKSQWAGAVDCVGGETLTNMLKTLQPYASVAACGLVGGAALNISVFPFILRGVNLLGIDSGEYPMAKRRQVWENLAGAWKFAQLESLCQEITLEQLDEAVDKILQGGIQGRTVVTLH